LTAISYDLRGLKCPLPVLKTPQDVSAAERRADPRRDDRSAGRHRHPAFLQRRRSRTGRERKDRRRPPFPDPQALERSAFPGNKGIPGRQRIVVESAVRSGVSMRGLPRNASNRSFTKASGRSLVISTMRVRRSSGSGQAGRRLGGWKMLWTPCSTSGRSGRSDMANDRLHAQQLLAMRRAQQIDEHVERHRIDRLVLDDREGADRGIVAVHVMRVLIVVPVTDGDDRGDHVIVPVIIMMMPVVVM
jgi:hypothetical protein